MVNVLLILAAYLLGSIPIGFLLVRWAKGIDVRTQGSGNIGMTNVWRVAGAPWGIATLALDILKGVLAVALSWHWAPDSEAMRVFCSLSALFGNIFSLFLGFKGGKGIGISVGIFFSLLPLESSIGLVLFLIALGLGRMVSLGSLLGASAMAGLTLYHQGITWLSSLAITAAAMIWWTHRQNIRRILNGSENRIGKGKRG